MVELYLLPGGMLKTDSRWRYDPSTIKLTRYFSLCGQWNPFISCQLLGKFLCDLGILSSSNTMRNPSLETKSRQRISQHRISRHRLRKCLGSSEHSCGVIPLSLYGTYCWGHSPALTNQNYVFKWRHKCVSEGWWDLGHRTWFGSVRISKKVRTSKEARTSNGG